MFRIVPMVSIAVGIAIPLVGTSACTRAESTDKGQTSDNVEAARPRTPTRHAPVKVAPVRLGQFSPAGDRLSVMLRIDRLAAVQLDRSADAIMAPLPDYQRVFGGQPATLVDRFDIVFVSTAEPRLLTASTLAARSLLARDKLREVLAYPDSGVSWQQAQERHVASFASNARFGHSEPRLYFQPDERWIVLTHPAELGALLPATGAAAEVARKAPSAWLGRLGAAEALGGTDNLLAAFEARRLIESVQIPYLGSLRLPGDLGVTLTGDADKLVLSGWMVFAEAADARSFEAAGVSARQMAEAEGFVAMLQPYGAARALQSLQLSRSGTRIDWRASVTVADVQAMSAFAAQLAAQWMRGSAVTTGPR